MGAASTPSRKDVAPVQFATKRDKDTHLMIRILFGHYAATPSDILLMTRYAATGGARDFFRTFLPQRY